MTNVVACIDGSNITPAVCAYAAWTSLHLGAPLKFLHVLDKAEYPTAPKNFSGNIGLGSRESLLSELTALDEKRGKIAMEHGHLFLEEAKARALAFGITDPICRQRHGDLVDTLIEMENDIRLLVMGKQGSVGDTIGDHVGNNLERVVRTMHRPILVTPQTFKAPSSIMIAFDGSETTRKGVEMVAGSPLFKGLLCHVVMVGDESKALTEHLNWAKNTLESATGFTVTTAVLAGEVKHALCNYRDQHDIGMVVMGAYGHSKIRQFLVGSTTTKMIQHITQVPLLLLR
ncbi:MAG: universal stress protein [Methylotenera sp.]|nr:universal stress protein [Methylotenera sp.]MDP2404456.1 universal stress protein [Methylotenera sp.]MDP3094152.1 universal stress protein [Methylotenera sp.]MDZ4222457.1 universal stress protein [Methylotenera sp.]